MEHLDFHRDVSAQNIRELIARLTSRNLLTPESGAAIPLYIIEKFAAGELADRIRRSGTVKREVPFVLGLSPSEIYPDDNFPDDETVLVHGIIDCFFIEENQIVLVDYKSDYVTEKTLQKLIDSYRIQLRIYKKAIERGEQKTVKETLLYLFSLDRCISVQT
jgi:ATP-dependent helicase/nuclease subunit A